AALERAGVAAARTRYNGVTHGFVGMEALLDKGRAAVAESAAALRSAFGQGERVGPPHPALSPSGGEGEGGDEDGGEAAKLYLARGKSAGLAHVGAGGHVDGDAS